MEAVTDPIGGGEIGLGGGVEDVVGRLEADGKAGIVPDGFDFIRIERTSTVFCEKTVETEAFGALPPQLTADTPGIDCSAEVLGDGAFEGGIAVDDGFFSVDYIGNEILNVRSVMWKKCAECMMGYFDWGWLEARKI